MRVVLNIIWLIFAGLPLALAYAIAGIVMCVLIITIPFGIQAFKLAGFSLWPFGRTAIQRDAGAGSVIGNVIWVILAGWWLALMHLISGIVLCITIIGIPMGIADFKLVPLALVPFGKEVVSTEEAAAIHGARAYTVG